MATRDMRDVFPDNTDHQVKRQKEIETIYISDDDVIVEDPSESKEDDKKLFGIVPISNKTKSFIERSVERIIMPRAFAIGQDLLYDLADLILAQIFKTNKYSSRRVERDLNGNIDYNGITRTRSSIDDPFESNYYYERRGRTSRNDSFDLNHQGFVDEDTANDCLKYLKEIINEDGSATVEDFYKYMNKQCPNRMCYRWGWLTLNSARVVRVGRGYMIKFPEVVRIDN